MMTYVQGDDIKIQLEGVSMTFQVSIFFPASAITISPRPSTPRTSARGEKG